MVGGRHEALCPPWLDEDATLGVVAPFTVRISNEGGAGVVSQGAVTVINYDEACFSCDPREPELGQALTRRVSCCQGKLKCFLRQFAVFVILPIDVLVGDNNAKLSGIRMSPGDQILHHCGKMLRSLGSESTEQR